MITYVIPTRDRSPRLCETLLAIDSLGPHAAEILVVDNASAVAAVAPPMPGSGVPVRVIRLDRNHGAAARNHAARAADPSSEWLVMLDDDSHPVDLGLLDAVASADSDVSAIGAEISLPSQGRREAGGLPEVFIGCGVAIRRSAFLDAGGYDAAFDYYAEEYDLAARLLLAGSRITLDRRFRVAHHKVSQGRSMGRILRRLVRNNAWVNQRYAPESLRWGAVRETLTRYGRIAAKEHAVPGYLLGAVEALATLHRQSRRPMPAAIYDRFTGLAAARAALYAAHSTEPFHTAAIVEPGKNAGIIALAAKELGIRLVNASEACEARIIGTLSPGPMLDAWDRLHRTAGPRLIAPWMLQPAETISDGQGMNTVPAAA
ncbi:MAG: glycosyltransferase [Phycisphaeraceae bacterium]|nr:glycosyltransferase [Phycisphaeraceae bacterium]